MVMGNFQEKVTTGTYSLMSFILNVATVGAFISAQLKHNFRTMLGLDSPHD